MEKERMLETGLEKNIFEEYRKKISQEEKQRIVDEVSPKTGGFADYYQQLPEEERQKMVNAKKDIISRNTQESPEEFLKDIGKHDALFANLVDLYWLTNVKDEEAQLLAKQCAIYYYYHAINFKDADLTHPSHALFSAVRLGVKDDFLIEIIGTHNEAKRQISESYNSGKKDEAEGLIKKYIKMIKKYPLFQIDNSKELIEAYIKIREKYNRD